MTKAYLEITLSITAENRATAGAIYTKYKQAFINNIQGASSKELLMRDEDVQVLHGFDTVENANAYLKSELFNNDVVKELAPLLIAKPDMKIYSIA
jgi:hypothetical protein